MAAWASRTTSRLPACRLHLAHLVEYERTAQDDGIGKILGGKAVEVLQRLGARLLHDPGVSDRLEYCPIGALVLTLASLRFRKNLD